METQIEQRIKDLDSALGTLQRQRIEHQVKIDKAKEELAEIMVSLRETYGVETIEAASEKLTELHSKLDARVAELEKELE